ncbi:MAG: SGNH/GDSL hydrolase family protein, partial [Chitinophagia bacterium]|nr:SGNH/GDSL hydrolase family protein [Chitinophagia bacterium]
NIPDINALPFFTTVRADGLYIPRQSLADSLTAFYASMNYSFQMGYNYFIIRDHAGNLRQAVPGELILLNVPMDSLTCAAWGSFKAIPSQYVLTTDEITNIRTATARYNETIKGAALRNNLGYVDMASYLTSLSSGLVYNGINYNTTFVKGGAFSLDGVHPNARGYAMIANKIITDINAKYGSTINLVDVNKYPGVMFP